MRGACAISDRPRDPRILQTSARPSVPVKLGRVLASAALVLAGMVGEWAHADTTITLTLPPIICCDHDKADLRLYLQTQEITERFVPATLGFRNLALTSRPLAGRDLAQRRALKYGTRPVSRLPQITRPPAPGTFAPSRAEGPQAKEPLRSELALEIARDRLRLRLRLGTVPALRVHPYPKHSLPLPQEGYSRMPARAGHPRLPAIGNGLGRLR